MAAVKANNSHSTQSTEKDFFCPRSALESDKKSLLVQL